MSEEENMIKDVRNRFRLEKLINDTIRDFFKLGKNSLNQKKKIKQLKTEYLEYYKCCYTKQ